MITFPSKLSNEIYFVIRLCCFGFLMPFSIETTFRCREIELVSCNGSGINEWWALQNALENPSALVCMVSSYGLQGPLHARYANMEFTFGMGFVCLHTKDYRRVDCILERMGNIIILVWISNDCIDGIQHSNYSGYHFFIRISISWRLFICVSIGKNKGWGQTGHINCLTQW